MALLERQPEIGELKIYQQGDENPYVKRMEKGVSIQESEPPISSDPNLQRELRKRAQIEYMVAINSRDCGSHRELEM